jgi:hypothetical protein
MSLIYQIEQEETEETELIAKCKLKIENGMLRELNLQFAIFYSPLSLFPPVQTFAMNHGISFQPLSNASFERAALVSP